MRWSWEGAGASAAPFLQHWNCFSREQLVASSCECLSLNQSSSTHLATGFSGIGWQHGGTVHTVNTCKLYSPGGFEPGTNSPFGHSIMSVKAMKPGESCSFGDKPLLPLADGRTRVLSMEWDAFLLVVTCKQVFESREGPTPQHAQTPRLESNMSELCPFVTIHKLHETISSLGWISSSKCLGITV